jgi:ribosome-associated toxin RatA of RatAB toxin-antitoxin module
MPFATRSIRIETPVETVFEVIRDYPSYPRFLPEVKAAEVLERRGNEVDVKYQVEVMKTIRYTLKMREERPSRIHWSFVGGEMMRDNKGFWELKPEGENATVATYNIEVTLGPLVPKAIVNALVSQSLPKMLECFKRRAESVASSRNPA